MKAFLIVVVYVLMGCSSVVPLTTVKNNLIIYKNGTAEDTSGKVYDHFRKQPNGRFVCHTMLWSIDKGKLFIGIQYVGDVPNRYLGVPAEGITDVRYYLDLQNGNDGWVNWYHIDEIKTIMAH